MDSTDTRSNGISQSYSMADVEQLVRKFYQPGPPHDIANTEKALQALQRSQHGWQIADTLLQSQDANVRFFGALTFTIKTNQDWDSLSEADATALLYRLVGWLIQLVKAEESALVLKKLSSALVSYYLRPSGALDRCVWHLIVSFQQGQPLPLDRLSTDHTISSSAINALNGMQAKTIMWFAGGLVEEVSKLNGASIQTYKYFERISSNTGDVVDLLRHSLNISSIEDLSVAENGIKCFQSWVLYAQRDWVDKGSELQALRSLTPLAMTAMQNEGLYDAVTEMFTDTLNHFPAFLTDDDFRTLSIFLSSDDARMNVSRLRGGQGDIDEDTMSFAKLLLAYGDAAIQDLAQKPDDSQLNQIIFQLLELLKCEGYGGVEDEICSQALEFWTNYTEFVIDSLFDYEGDKPAWIEVARQRIEAAIEACWVKIRMPRHEVALTWDSDARSSFKNFRKDVHDLLQSSYRLLGGGIFGKLAQLALQSLNERAWLPLEATLFCLNAFGDLVADDESFDGILSRFFSSSFFADMMNTAEEIPAKTRQTAVTMISRYTAFFERHTEHLPAVLNFLFESLKSPALASVVAKAIFSACSSCREKLTMEVSGFLRQYEAILTWGPVETSIKEKLIGAIAAIIQALPRDEHKVAPLAQLVHYIERDVENCVEAIKVSDADESQECGLSALKCLVSMGKALQAPDEAVIDLDVKSSPSTFWTDGQGAPLQARVVWIMETLTALMKRSSEAVEAGCQILRVGYKERNGGLFVFPLRVTVNFVLAGRLDTARLDYRLDTAGVFLVSQVNGVENAMINAAPLFLGHLHALIASMNYDPSFDPEVSTSAIDLVDRMIPRYLNSMMNTPNIQMLFDFVLRALMVPDIMPKRSAAQFWATFMQKYEVTEELTNFHRAAMGRYGPFLSQILVRKFAGEASRSELDELAEPLKKMVFCQPSAKAWLSDALNANAFPSEKVGPLEKRVWLQKIFSLRGAKGTNQAIKDFWIQCKGPEFSYTR